MTTITSPRDPSPADRITTPSLPQTPSLNGTPTSSVRPSVELPQNSNGRSSSPAPQNAPPAQRRNRAALRDYYNLKSKGPPNKLSRTGSIASNASDSTVTSTAPGGSILDADGSPLSSQLDEPSFDADNYVSELLKTSSLRDILRTESALVSEIRNLDGERKALVYDNYSKLIKAVGTIGEMQKGMQKNNGRGKGGLDGVEILEQRLKELSEVVRDLEPEKTERASGGKERRERRRQRELVTWVLDAPDRLEVLAEQGDTEQARVQWATVEKLLDQWNGVKGVSEVRSACQRIMQKLHDEEDGD